MIKYNECDMPDLGLVEMLEMFGGKEPTEEEVWEKARRNKNVPVFENIYTTMLFQRLEKVIKEDEPENEVEFGVNCMVSYFMVNGEHIHDRSDYCDVTK